MRDLGLIGYRFKDLQGPLWKKQFCWLNLMTGQNWNPVHFPAFCQLWRSQAAAILNLKVSCWVCLFVSLLAHCPKDKPNHRLALVHLCISGFWRHWDLGGEFGFGLHQLWGLSFISFSTEVFLFSYCSGNLLLKNSMWNYLCGFGYIVVSLTSTVFSLLLCKGDASSYQV